MGTSVLYSSGDDGVAGGDGLCLNKQGSSIFFKLGLFWLGILGQASKSGTRFNPGFPVGNDDSSRINTVSMCFIGHLSIRYCSWGHSGQPGINRWWPRRSMRAGYFLWRRILKHLCVRVLPWNFCNFYSTLAYRIPSYQTTAVNNFLTNHKPPFTSAQFNTSGVRTYSPGIFSPDLLITFLCSLAVSRIWRLTGMFSKFSRPILLCLKWLLKQVQTTLLVCSFPGLTGIYHSSYDH